MFFFLFKHRNKCMIVCLRKSKPQINVIFLKDKPICCPFPSLQLLISLLSNCCCVIMQNISLSLSSPTFVSFSFFHSLPPVATPLPVVPFSGLLCLPGRSDKNHTPTCLLFSINEINHKYHHYALAPACPQARDTKRVRESRIEMQEVDMCRCMAECMCSCLSVMVLMLHME